MTTETMFSRLKTGPYAGRYAVHRKGDKRLGGLITHGARKGERWSRLPYYGHVWTEGGHWRAIGPGASRAVGAHFPTRQLAGEYLLNFERPA